MGQTRRCANTANDVTQLPPELLRKGRFDDMFWIDLPNQPEREAIWRIQIAKFRRDPKQFDIVQLARATDGLTKSRNSRSIACRFRRSDSCGLFSSRDSIRLGIRSKSDRSRPATFRSQ